jgi:hypothetical protein
MSRRYRGHGRDLWAIPAFPLEQPVYVQGGRVEVLARVLAGLELGAFDREAVRWLRHAPAPMCMAVCAWIERARESGRRLFPEETKALDDAFVVLAAAGEPELAFEVFRMRQRLTGQGGKQ